MNTSNQKQSVLIWDFPVRAFHWLLVISFAGAWITSESEAWQMIHYAFGYSACVLVLFRIIWGLVGTKYARFTQFIKSPAATIHHLKSLFATNSHSEPGHNPAGALAMVSLMALILLIGLTGYWNVKELFGNLAGELHESLASIAMAVVIIHITAAIIMSFLQKENLVRSMITGEKQGTLEQAIRYPMYFIGICFAVAWAYSFYLVVSGALPAFTQ